MTDEEMATAYALEWGDKTDGTYACARDGFLAGLKAGRATARVVAEAGQFLKETEE